MHPGKLLAVLLLFMATAAASVSIVSPKPGVQYMLGEAILLAGNAQADAACSGDVVVLLDGAEVRRVTADFKANAVIDLSAVLGQTTVAPAAGTHTLKVASQCLGEAEAPFTVTSTIDIIYTLNTDRLMVGDLVSVQAYAFRKEPVYGITSIIIDNSTFVDSVTWAPPGPGQHALRLVANDSFGNYGEKTVIVTVSDQLVVSAAADKPSYRPGERLTLTINATGAFGGSRIALPFVYAFGRTYEQSDLVVPEKAMSGTHTLTVEAVNGSNRGRTEVRIFVEPIPSLGVSLPPRVVQGSTLNITASVTDQAGAAMPADVTVAVLNRSGAAVYSATVPSNELKQLALPELPPGDYVVSVGSLNKTANSSLRVSPAPPKPQPGQVQATGSFLGRFSDIFLGVIFLLAGLAGWYYYESRKNGHGTYRA